MLVVSILISNSFYEASGSIMQKIKIIIDGEISYLSEMMIFRNDSIYIPLVSAGSDFGYSVIWDADKREAIVTKYSETSPANMFHYSSSDLDGIQLFALNKNQSNNDQMSDFILSVDGENKVFKWAGQNIDRQPITSLINDNQHIAIVTNTAAGTGICGQKLYVVDKKSMEEIPVDDISEYFKNQVEFSSDDLNFYMTMGDRRWTLANDNLDISIANEWAKVNDDLLNLESYNKHMINRAIQYQSYYIADGESVRCMIGVKNEYGSNQQAIGAFKFEYVFNGNNYSIYKMDFIRFYAIEELNKWLSMEGAVVVG